MKLSLHLLGVAIASIAMSNATAATLLLHTFEGTDEGYILDGVNHSTSATPDNTGVFSTDGSYSLKLEGHTNGWGQPGKANISASDLENAAYDTISFDYHLPGFGNWANLGIRIAAEQWSGFTNETVTADTGTISYNYKAEPAYAPGSGWAVFILDGFNEAGGGTNMSPVYIDNVRLSSSIPEPSTGLLALALVGLTGMSRRRLR